MVAKFPTGMAPYHLAVDATGISQVGQKNSRAATRGGHLDLKTSSVPPSSFRRPDILTP